MTSKRIALFVDVMLSRVSSALLIFALLVIVLALTLGAFPRTLLGALILIIVGLPFCLVGEVLGEFGSSWGPRTRHAQAGGLLGLIALVVLLWGWCASHESFIRQNFF